FNAGWQPRTMFAVSEDDSGFAIVVRFRDVLANVRIQREQIVRFAPKHVVDADCERALGTGRNGRSEIRQWWLQQLKRLECLTAFAAAEHFVAGFSVSCAHDIAVDLDGAAS